MIRWIALAACICGLSACGVFPDRNNVTRDFDLSKDNSYGVVVMGVDPRYQVGVIAMDKVSDWEVKQTFSANLDFVIFPEQGYIVAKLKPLADNQRYVLFQIAPNGLGNGTGAGVYYPCTGDEALTFKVSPGEVTYLGDVSFSLGDQGLQAGYSKDPARARAFLASAYPHLVQSTLMEEQMQPMQVYSRACSGLHVMLSIPRIN